MRDAQAEILILLSTFIFHSIFIQHHFGTLKPTSTSFDSIQQLCRELRLRIYKWHLLRFLPFKGAK